MISVIGIGNAASAIASKFADLPQYEVYTMNSKVEKNSKTQFKLNTYDTPEEYEKNAPRVKKFLKNLKDLALLVYLQINHLDCNSKETYHLVDYLHFVQPYLPVVVKMP